VTKAPAHLRTPRGKERLKRLRAFANALRGRYGVPIYLCGSALLDVNEEPRDWDMRAALDEADFARFYGDANQWEQDGRTGAWTSVRWKWSDDMVKQSRDGYRRTLMNIDFQVYPAKHAAAYKNLPRFRLDTRRREADGR